ncbi:hypothetical protein PCE1_002411 [Barthelona sp. PCE]
MEPVDRTVAQFGDLPLNMSQTREYLKFTKVEELTAELDGQSVLVRARVQRVRGRGKSAFVLLREQFATVQCCCFASEEIPRPMVKYIQKIQPESMIDIVGTVTIPPKPISGASQPVEVQIEKVYVVNRSVPTLPFQMNDALMTPATRAEKGIGEISRDKRLDNRVFDLRVPTNLAIFKIQAMIGQLFREFLMKNNFLEIHSPKIIGGSSEGGSNVFFLEYFGREAALAQSPQLYKQMAICADFGRVFEVAPVFRAENSMTHRHMTEFVGFDVEMEIKEHYHEALELWGELMIYILKNVEERCAKEIEIVREQYPAEPFLIPDEVPIFTYAQAVEWLNNDLQNRIIPQVESGELELTKEEKESYVMLEPTDDIDTCNEKRLGVIIHNMHGTDLYTIDKFPLSHRPFYTMPDPVDPTITNSYDIFLRGEEICSGAQRIHEVEALLKRAEECGLDVNTLKDYAESFQYGATAMAGAGFGCERLVLFYLGIDNIRNCSLFPRDPKRLYP